MKKIWPIISVIVVAINIFLAVQSYRLIVKTKETGRIIAEKEECFNKNGGTQEYAVYDWIKKQDYSRKEKSYYFSVLYIADDRSVKQEAFFDNEVHWNEKIYQILEIKTNAQWDDVWGCRERNDQTLYLNK